MATAALLALDAAVRHFEAENEGWMTCGVIARGARNGDARAEERRETVARK